METKEALENHFLYTGQQYDRETGQYYLRARYYHPEIGRFTQEDTYRGDGLNLYAYCGNNPVMYYDPSGYQNQVNSTCERTGVNNQNATNVNRINEGGTVPRGTLSGKLDGLTTAERTMVDDLLNAGNNVEIIPRSNIPGDKTPDFLVNGVKTELKTLTGTSLNTPVTRIQDGFKQGTEAVIIDGRNTGLTLDDANTVIERALGKYGGELPGIVEIWTTEGILRR